MQDKAICAPWMSSAPALLVTTIDLDIQSDSFPLEVGVLEIKFAKFGWARSETPAPGAELEAVRGRRCEWESERSAMVEVEGTSAVSENARPSQEVGIASIFPPIQRVGYIRTRCANVVD